MKSIMYKSAAVFVLSLVCLVTFATNIHSDELRTNNTFEKYEPDYPYFTADIPVTADVSITSPVDERHSAAIYTHTFEIDTYASIQVIIGFDCVGECNEAENLDETTSWIVEKVKYPMDWDIQPVQFESEDSFVPSISQSSAGSEGNIIKAYGHTKYTGLNEWVEDPYMRYSRFLIVSRDCYTIVFAAFTDVGHYLETMKAYRVLVQTFEPGPNLLDG